MIGTTTKFEAYFTCYKHIHSNQAILYADSKIGFSPLPQHSTTKTGRSHSVPQKINNGSLI